MEFDIFRILVAFLSGYFLTLSGSLAQIVTNNKLASSSTLGFDGIGVVMILIAQFCISFLGFKFPIEYLSFALFLIFFAAFSLLIKNKFKIEKSIDFNQGMQKIILIGIGFNLLVGGIFSVIQFLFIAINYEFPTGIWFGNFKYFDQMNANLFTICFIIIFTLMSSMSKKLSYLSLGNDFARGLGIDVSKLVTSALLLSLFLTGLVISFFGVFSFIGLIFPHILRRISIFKYSMRNELMIGPLFAGVILSGIDFLCFNFDFYGAEIPVGMVCSVIGSFVLLFLLVQKTSSK